jgi:hypothetical protein
MLRKLSQVPLIALLASFPVAAQTPGASATPTSSDDRLFYAFIEDATVVDRQWWEGRLEYIDGDSIEITQLSGVVAFQPWDRVELGGRVGFGDSDVGGGLSDQSGSGATDLDFWGKYYFGGGGETEFAAGIVATIPTGDDNAGLGSDAFAVSAFGAIRHRLARAILSFHGGLRFNQDGQIFGVDLDGETSALLGGAIIAPLADQITVVGEVDFESGRFDGADDDLRVLGGLNWRVFNRGMFRAALGVGLSDGAPDWQVLIGYAASL